VDLIKHRRLWFLAVLLFVIAATLAACGGGAGDDAEGDTTDPGAGVVEEEAPDAEAPDAEAPAEEEASTDETPSDEGAEAGGYLDTSVSGEVEFWHFWGSPARRTAIRRVVALCQAELPNITVTEVFKPFGDIWTANVAAVAAGSGMPDVIVEDRPQLPQRARDEIATDLGPFIEEDGLDMASMFREFAWNEALFEGSPYGIPFETDVRVLFYNKNAFREAGLDPESPPETWEEAVEMGNQLDIGSGTDWERIGFMPLWNAGPDFWAYTNGWEAVVDGAPNVNDPAYLETIQWLNERVEHYGGWETLQNFRASYGSPPNDLFMSGAAPMFTDVAGYISQLVFYRPRVENAEGEMVEMEWGISHIPYNTERGNWSGGFALSIPRGADSPEAAWEFIKCAAGPIGQASWARDTFAIPTNIEAAEAPELHADPNWAIIEAELETSRGSTYVESYPNWSQEVNPRLEQVWRGELTPEQMVEEAQQAIDDVMAENQ
jgi:multiple sugar transport system substrate-binding protein